MAELDGIKKDADSSKNVESELEDLWKDDPAATSPQGDLEQQRYLYNYKCAKSWMEWNTRDVSAPKVMSDERGEYEVRVSIVLPGLKKKLGRNEPSNAEKLVVVTKEQSLAFALLMSVPGKTEKQKYHYHVNRLPDKIVAEKTKYKVKDDKVIVTLYKEVARSWVPELSTGGLETQPEEDEANSD